jgi:hypothetical protein
MSQFPAPLRVHEWNQNLKNSTKAPAMKNESNTGNSPSAVRKSRTFALAAVMLSTLVFASAALACDIIPTNDGGFAANCAATNGSGKIYVGVWDSSGKFSWQIQAYYQGRNAQYLDVFSYGAQVWAITDRATGEIGWVAYAASGWRYIPYVNYSAALVDVLHALVAKTPQSSTPPSTPMVSTLLFNPISEYCNNFRANQVRFTNEGYPMMHDYLTCGF